MKQLLFLLLFPCLALAQYQGNSNQKITLGEQTTADGLVYRGVANLDTVTATSKITRANKQDTSAYILLDTVTNLLWHYKIGSNAWTQAGGSTLDTATMLLPYYRAGRNTIIQAADVPTLNQNTTGSAATLTTGRTIQTNLSSTSAATFNGSANITPGVTGTLPVANGGTNTTSLTQNAILYGSSTSQVSTSSDLTFDGTVLKLSKNSSGATFATLPNIVVENSNTSTQSYSAIKVSANNNAVIGDILVDGLGNIISGGAVLFRTFTNHPFGISTNNVEKLRVNTDGEMWLGYTTDNGAYKLQVNGQIFATNATIATSDEKFKENITPLNKGLEIINKLNPVTFNFISDTENNFSEYEEVGFIAQDVDRALSTETFAKSIVKSADDSDPASTMGLATQNLIPILVKAIQEQQALIKALEQRILILENK